MRIHPGDVGIDAGNESADVALCIGAVAGPFGVHVAAIQKQPRRAVLFDIGRPERIGKLAQPFATQQVELKQAVARDVESLHEERVAIGAGVDVRHAPTIDANLRRLFQPGQAHGRLRLRLRLRGRGIAMQAQTAQQQAQHPPVCCVEHG